jgi:hypothetical protein
MSSHHYLLFSCFRAAPLDLSETLDSNRYGGGDGEEAAAAADTAAVAKAKSEEEEAKEKAKKAKFLLSDADANVKDFLHRMRHQVNVKRDWKRETNWFRVEIQRAQFGQIDVYKSKWFFCHFKAILLFLGES